MKFIYTMLMFLSAIHLVAQEVSIISHDVNAIHHVFPKIGFDLDVKFYDLSIEANYDSLKEIRFTEAQLKDKIDLQGYPQSNQSGGAKISFKLNGPIGGAEVLKSEVNTNKEGRSRREYFYEIQFYCSMNVIVEDIRGNVLFETQINQDKIINSLAYGSRRELGNRFNHIIFYTGKYKLLVLDVFNEANKVLNRNFGYQSRTRNVGFQTIGIKSHSDYDSWQKNAKMVERACEALNPFSEKEYWRMMMPAVDFWKSEAARYKEDDKDQKRLKSAALLNLSLAHMLADELLFAEGYANMVIELNLDSTRAKFILNEIDTVKSSLDRMNRPTRYFKTFK